MSRFIRGEERDQTALFPETLDDYIGEDNPVRFIDAFVETLDLDGLGFQRAIPKDTGRPPYDPADLLKLYIYGYLNGIRSSRKLERECGRNVELLWLLRRLSPDFKTIADFRRDNRDPIQGTCRQFTMLCRELGLFGGRLVAIDGSKFKAVNSKRRNYSRKALQRAIEEADEKIRSYLSDLDRADRDEPDEAKPSAEELREKIAALKERKTEEQAKLRKLRRSGQQQVSLTDPDARCMSQGKGSIIGYNLQTAVDSKHKLIVAHEVTSQVTDFGHLGRIAKAAKEALDCERLQVTADKGYYEVRERLQGEVRSPPRPQDLRDFRRVLAVLRRKCPPRQHRETVQRDQEVRGFALGRGRYELAGLGAPPRHRRREASEARGRP